MRYKLKIKVENHSVRESFKKAQTCVHKEM